MAILTIIDTDNPQNVITFESPTADSGIKGASAIQILGGKHTYMRRYLWLEAMEIVEADAVDGLSNDDKVAAKKKAKPVDELASQEQIAKVKELYTEEEITSMLSRLKIESLEKAMDSQVKKMIGARTGLHDQTETY